jgi:(1->4)-alpha-D-glucan 1-alpha-D-glucosylmutase
LGSDVNRLTALLVMICERHRRHRDYPRNDLHDALCELIACFPVYRTYVREDSEQVTEQDKEYITTSIEKAKANRSDIDPNLFDFLQELLLLRVQGDVETEFAMRFQQFTGPVMAKGVEDTTFYCYNRLVSLNEVGGNPGKFGISVDEFHQSCIETLQHWSQTMLATSTHDTKRSEDVRARINLLSEIPGQWSDAVNRWTKMTRIYRKNDYPDRNTEYLLYQTLVGAWPIGIQRLSEYMKKAVREAKAHTSWTDSDEEYEESLIAFIENIMNDARFIADLKKFVEPLIHAGRINSLSQTLIKLTAPGNPDIYQGTELWNLSLVDPDNRRPVDYELRRKLLSELPAVRPQKLLSRMDEGLPKMWVIRQTLALRNQNPEIFGAKGDYQPILAHGDFPDNIVAFSRGDRAITITPRLTMNLDDWKETTLELPEGTWHHQFTNEKFEGGITKISNLFANFPVCLLS